MLEILEKYVAPIGRIRDEADGLRILESMAGDFGFRSAFLIDYSPDQGSAVLALDTWPERGAAGARMVEGMGHVQAAESIDRMRDETPLVRFDPSAFEPTHPLLVFNRAYDLLDSVAVPIDQGNGINGVVGFSGAHATDAATEMALKIVSYCLFAQLRSLRHQPVVESVEPPPALSLRERQVMELSADGLTAREIADRLRISDANANRHADDVARRFGTGNRVHTLAELLRRRVLN